MYQPTAVKQIVSTTIFFPSFPTHVESISIFLSNLSLIRPDQNKVCNIFDSIGLKFLISFRLCFSNLNENRFRHNFQNCMNPYVLVV